MLRFTVRRIAGLVPVLFFVTFLTFVLIRLTPGDPVLVLIGSRETSETTIAAIREKYGLNDDILTAYAKWVANAAHGNLGESIRFRQDVGAMIAARLPISLLLVSLTMVISTLVAIPLGVLAALRKNTFVDYATSFIALIGNSSSVFFTAILGILVFSFWLRWLPPFGAGSGGLDTLYHMILPAGALAIGQLAFTSRITRSSMIEVLASDFIEAARAKGLPERIIIIKHALRNALVPLLTIASLQFGFLLVGTVLVEYTVGIGGVGSLYTDAIRNRDYPVVQGVTLFMAVAFVLLNLITDLLYGLIDPRLTYD
jgi:peptide/nickel transport system permease protein